VVEVSALAPEQAARLAGILAEMADGTPVPSVRDRIADDVGGRD
jgi:phage-related baseplate assembly protein